MKMDEHARAWGHEFVTGLLNASALIAEQRTSLHWEILSHLHEAAERRVEARGGQTITLADLQAIVQDMGGPQGIAAAFLENRVAATPRAGFWKRAGAFVVDVALVGAAWGVLNIFWSIIFPFGFGGAYYVFEDLMFFLFIVTCFLYLVLMEVRYGQTVGKMVFRIRAVRVDGRPLEYREAMIRNVAKVVPPLLLLDVLLYLLAFHKDDQRASDRLAETIVIDTAKPVWSMPPAPSVPAPAPAQPTFVAVDETAPGAEPEPRN